MGLTINSFDSNSINTLFSSLSSSTNTSSASTGLESLLSDYNSIATGSYSKLLKAYYAKGLDEIEESSKDDSNKKSLSETKSDAESLVSSANVLLNKGSDSIWNKVEQEDGSLNYDKDKIYSSIANYIDSYNNMIKSGGDSSNVGVLTQVNGMVNTSKNAYSTLAKVGITIGSNNTLTMDEKFFKESASMETAKSLFNGTSSYLSTISSKASSVKAYSENALSSLTGNKSYTNNGSYSKSTSDLVSSFNTKT